MRKILMLKLSDIFDKTFLNFVIEMGILWAEYAKLWNYLVVCLPVL